ncbi:MAG: response regulator [Acidobacteriota bacterium]|nr:response regulator [Acidobacteriota bacterium]
MLRGRRKVPLGLVLVIPFLLQLVIVVGAMLWLALSSGHRAVEPVAAQLRSDLNQRIWQFLDSHLEIPHRVNELNADALVLGQLEPADAEALNRHFWHQLQVFDSLNSIFFATTEGGVAEAGRSLNGTLVVDSTTLDPELGLVAGTRYRYEAAGAGGRGELLETTPGFDARQHPWFEEAVQSGRPVWNQVYPFFAEENLVVTASKPVYRPDGSLLGVLGVELTLRRVGEFLRQLDTGHGELTFIVDRSGFLIATSTGERPYLAAQDPRGRRLRARESTSALLGATAGFLEQREGGLQEIDGPAQESFELDGVTYYLHVAPFYDPRGLDWLTVVVLPEAKLSGLMRGSSSTTLWLSLGAVLLAVLLSVLSAGLITRPIRRLRQASQAIAGGHLGQAVPVSNIRELGDLGQAFNAMTEQLRESFTELETRVALRTHQLQEAKEESDAANQAKTRFLAVLSHEIRSPLGVILGYLDLLQDPRVPEEDHQRYLDIIRRACTHLSRLLGDFLDISRIEAGRLELNERRCELAELLEDLDSSFRPLAEEASLDLELRTLGRLPWRFTADATRLRQVLSNLLSNGLRYTDEGGVRLTVEAPGVKAGQKPETAELVFVVRDTGAGIRPEDQEKIFQRFTQLETSSHGGSGFGLGLAITRQLVSLMGGAVRLESRLGAGSAFTVRVPVTGCQRWSKKPHPADSIEEDLSPSAAPPLEGRVLIADDSLDLLELCVRMLERWGLSCVTARDGQEAVELATRQHFDLILMDWQMPRLDGLAATKELRRRGFQTTVVALTAAAMQGDRERCLEAGCTGYLVKPIDFKELFRLLRRLLAEARRPDQRSSSETIPMPLPEGGDAGSERISTAVAASTDEIDREVAKLARGYLAGLPQVVNDLRQALREQRWEEFQAGIHRLAGTAGTYGFTSIYTFADRLERAALQGTGPHLEPLLERLGKEVQQVVISWGLGTKNTTREGEQT